MGGEMRAHPSAIRRGRPGLQRCHVEHAMKALSVLGAVNRFQSSQNRLMTSPPPIGPAAKGRARQRGEAGRVACLKAPFILGQTREKPKKCCPDKSKLNGMRVFPS